MKAPTQQTVRERTMFKVGQKVVCIDDRPQCAATAPFMPLRLVHGAIYTIRSIHIEPHIEGYGVRLEELLNPSMIWANDEESEWSYHPRRFLPLVDEPEKELCGHAERTQRTEP